MFGNHIFAACQSPWLILETVWSTDSMRWGPRYRKCLALYPDYNHQDHLSMRGDFREKPISARSLSPQGQEHIMPYHGHGYPMGTQRSPPSFLQPMESYNTLRYSSSSSSPRPNYESRAWPPGMSSWMPVGITSPDMMPQSSSGSLNKGRAHHRSQRPTILNYNRGKQNMGFSNGYNNYCGNQESYVSGPSKQKGGSLVDLYSKEAISVTQVRKRNMILPDQQQYKQHFSNSNNQVMDLQKMGASSSRLRKTFLENNGRTTSLQGGNHPCYPTAGFPFSSTLQNNGRMGRNSGFMSPSPLTSKGQRSFESSHFATPRKMGSSLDKGKSIISRPSSVNPPQETSHFFTQRQFGLLSLEKGKGIMLSPSSAYPPQGAKNTPSHSNSKNNLFGLGPKHDERMVSKAPETKICMVNRNPSEFNDLRELNKYLMDLKDLQPKEEITRETPGRKPRGDAKKQRIWW